jgi:hypothetical protein
VREAILQGEALLMSTAIIVDYEPDGDDWAIEASSGRGERRTGRASGLLAARERADRLVAELAGDTAGEVRVVHLLHGDALAFSAAYLSARLGIAPTAGADSSGHQTTVTQTATNHHGADLE